MSHRANESVKMPRRRRWWVEAGIGAALLLLMALFLVGRMRHGLQDWSQFTAQGVIIETRIVADRSLEGQGGGGVLYRIEAHVNYEIRGKRQDRWLGASEVSADRSVLAARLANQPKRCEVYWAPHHPENAKCLLK